MGRSGREKHVCVSSFDEQVPMADSQSGQRGFLSFLNQSFDARDIRQVREIDVAIQIVVFEEPAAAVGRNEFQLARSGSTQEMSFI